MSDQQSSRSAGTQSAAQRPYVGAAVNFIGDNSRGGMVGGQRYAAIITAVYPNPEEPDASESVSARVLAPSGDITLAGLRFSPSPEPGAWTWPVAGGGA